MKQKTPKLKTDGTPKKSGGARPGAGGPPKEVDLEKAATFCRFRPTLEEICGALGVGEDTFRKALDAAGTKWEAFLDQHSANVKLSLRRKQITTALKGNTTMLVWLGKNLLGQTDKTEIGFDPNKPVKFRLAMGKQLGNEGKNDE